MDSRQACGWCWTLNNYSDEDFNSILNLLPAIVKFAVVGKETCPTTGTRHLQCYGLFNRRYRFGAIRDLLGPRAHIEPAKGSPDQNFAYCSKEGDYTTIGERPCRKTTALDLVCQKLKGGASLRDIAESDPTTFVRYHGGLKALTNLLGEATIRDWKSEVIVMVGPTGSGKSRRAAELCRQSSTYYKPRGEWWDGYAGHTHVIIDDFYGWLRYDEMLRILDRYPHRVPIKGGFTQFLAKFIFITSNVPIDDWYHGQWYQQAQRDALLRRIDHYCINKLY